MPIAACPFDTASTAASSYASAFVAASAAAAAVHSCAAASEQRRCLLGYAKRFHPHPEAAAAVATIGNVGVTWRGRDRHA